MAKKRNTTPSYDNISMDQIIGAPLRATATANSMMAREQVKFLMDYCFTKEGNNHRPVMVEMVMSRSEMTKNTKKPGFKRYNMTFRLPLLTLIPLNSLSVEEFEIDFDMEITSMAKNATNNSIDTDKEQDGDQEMQFMGKISNKEQHTSSSQYQRKVNSRLSINVKGGQLPLPLGLTSIIDLFTKNIEPTNLEEDNQITLK